MFVHNNPKLYLALDLSVINPSYSLEERLQASQLINKKDFCRLFFHWPTFNEIRIVMHKNGYLQTKMAGIVEPSLFSNN